MGPPQFCLQVFLGIQRNPKQKDFLNSCEGFLNLIPSTWIRTCTGPETNMFKHYKLKSSFLIIKDNNTKGRDGGDKPRPSNFVRSINPMQYNFLFSSDLFLLDPIWSVLIQFGSIWFDPVWSWSSFIQFGPINLISTNL